jgi:hypothetical protein
VANERNTTIKTSQKMVLSIPSNGFTVDHYSGEVIIAVAATYDSYEADTSWMLESLHDAFRVHGDTRTCDKYGDRVVGMRAGKEVVTIGKA